MRVKACSKCKLEKEVGEFRFTGSKNGCRRHSYCIPCQDEYLKARYTRTKEKHLDSAKKFSEQMKDHWTQIINTAKDNPCKDCGIKYHPICMDFDHLDPNSKYANISTLRFQLKSKKHEHILLAEIAKCELVCSNCHRLRTYRRLQSQ